MLVTTTMMTVVMMTTVINNINSDSTDCEHHSNNINSDSSDSYMACRQSSRNGGGDWYLSHCWLIAAWTAISTAAVLSSMALMWLSVAACCISFPSLFLSMGWNKQARTKGLQMCLIEEARQGRAGQGRAGQGRAGQGRAGQSAARWAGQGWAGGAG